MLPILVLFLLPLSLAELIPHSTPRVVPYKDHIVSLADMPRDVSATRGGRLKLTCSFSGYPSVAVQWKRSDERPIMGDLDKPVANAEENAKDGTVVVNTTLIIDCVSSGDLGFFTCTGSNGKTSVSSTTLVLVKEVLGEVICEPYVIRPRSTTYTNMITKSRGSETAILCGDSKKAPVMLTVDQQPVWVTDEDIEKAAAFGNNKVHGVQSALECVPSSLFADGNIFYTLNRNPFDRFVKPSPTKPTSATPPI